MTGEAPNAAQVSGPVGDGYGPDGRLCLDVVVEMSDGLHARPAMKLVDCATRFESGVKLWRSDKPDEPVDGKSIMELLMLEAAQGTLLCVEVCGRDAPAAAEAIAGLFRDKFGE